MRKPPPSDISKKRKPPPYENPRMRILPPEISTVSITGQLKETPPQPHTTNLFDGSNCMDPPLHSHHTVY
jgi:hypothetical protein